MRNAKVQINIGTQPKGGLLILNSSDTLDLKNFLVNETGRAWCEEDYDYDGSGKGATDRER